MKSLRMLAEQLAAGNSALALERVGDIVWIEVFDVINISLYM